MNPNDPLWLPEDRPIEGEVIPPVGFNGARGGKWSAAVAEFIAIMAQVRHEYLQTSYQAIDETYGSFEGFVRDGLALGDKQITELKSYLLEPEA